MRTAQQIQYPVGRDNEIYAAQLSTTIKTVQSAVTTLDVISSETEHHNMQLSVF